MKTICSIIKGKEHFYCLDGMSSADMAIINCAVHDYYNKLKREGSSSLADEVEIFLKDFKNIENVFVSKCDN